MADAVRVSDLRFCEIGQERDGVNVDVGQLPAIAGAIPSLPPPIATEAAEVTESPHEQRAKGRKPLVRLFGDVSAVTENLMADENRFCASMGSVKFIAVYGNGAPLQRAAAQLSGCMSACSVHGHAHARAWSLNIPASDLKECWGARGCTCWAM